MKKRNIIEWGSVAIIFIIVIVLSVVMFKTYRHESRENVLNRSSIYVQDFAEGLKVKLDDKFAESQSSVNAVAEMISDSIIVEDDIPKMLYDLEMETGFDYVRYVDIKGISHTSSGKTADVSDRDYFTEGIKGNTGSTYITDSRLSSQRIIGFYAPVYTNEKTSGVIVAFYNEDTLTKSLEYSFYGEKASVGLVTVKGKTIACSPSERLQTIFDIKGTDNINELITSEFFDGKSYGAITEACKKHTEASFNVIVDGNETSGCIIPLDIKDINVCIIFPVTAGLQMFEDEIIPAEHLQRNLIMLFTCFAAYLLLLCINRITREKRQNHMLEKAANTDELTGLLNRRSYERKLEFYKNNPLPEHLTYIAFDLNGLKKTNDTYGHVAGDELIKGAADCLEKAVGKYGDIFRTGGDEFMAILIADEKLLKKINSDIEYYASVWKGTYTDDLSFSYGYAGASEAGEKGIMELALLADKRMYENKSAYYKQKGIDRRK